MKNIISKVVPIARGNQKQFKSLSQIQKATFIKQNSTLKTNNQSQLKFKRLDNTYVIFNFAKTVHNVPSMGDSISEGTILEYTKKVGDYVQQDETFAIIETDKVQVEIKSPDSGQLTQLFANEGDTVEVGKQLFELDTDAKAPEGGAKKTEAKKEEPKKDSKPQQQQQQQQQQQYQAPQTGSSQKSASQQQTTQQKGTQLPPQAPATQIQPPGTYVTRGERREPMNRMRQKIAQRLKESQNDYAQLTTFQECDMSAVMEIRNKYQKDFQKRHDVKLGFMSFFVKAATHALQKSPIVNAVIDGKEIVYRDYVDISCAVATPNGLMVPVLRNCENQGFADIEKNLAFLAEKGKQGKITLEDMAGGTFTISNGGVFGSMMGTPILNPPQSAILGMHSIINRPVVRNDQIVARPMMYLALTYDHRIVDGREAVTFLKSIANEIEDPRRILLDL